MARSYHAIDSDAHVLEPGELWFDYIEAKYRDRAPRMVKTEEGREIFRIEGSNVLDLGKLNKAGFAGAGAFGMRDGRMPQGTSYYDGQPGGFDPHKRIPDMDAEGIDAAFLFPTLGAHLAGIKDGNMATAAFRAYNRWLADYCKPYPDRLFGVAVVPLQSVAEAVEEIRYVTKELGFRAGCIRPNPYVNRPLHDPANEPVWQVAQDLGFAIAIHAAAATTGMPVLGYDRFTEGMAVRHAVSHTLEMLAAVTSFVMCGICDRFPRLRVGFMESGGGWVAGWLDRMDRHFDDQGMNDTGLSLRPSEIFRRQCFISFEPVERSLPLVAEHIGSDNILWATDYPHPDGFPNAPALIRNLGLSADLLEKVMAGGAKRMYGLS